MSKIVFKPNSKGIVKMLQDPMMIPLVERYAKKENGEVVQFKGWDRQKAIVYPERKDK